MPNPYITQIKLGTGPNDPIYDIKATKMASGPIGTTLKPIYINNDGDPTVTEVSESGNRWGVIPLVGATGVLEAGKYIDFHNSDEHTGDYDYRITTNASSLTLTPTTAVDSTSTSTGSLIVTGGMGVSQTITTDKLKITSTQSINSGFSTQGALQIGELNNYNLAFDRDSIMARNDGAATTLSLNQNGGAVRIGKDGIILDALGRDTNLAAGTPYTVLSATWKNADGSANLSTPVIRLIGCGRTDAANAGVMLGSGNGVTIISSGEGASSFPALDSTHSDSENMFLVSDNYIYLISGAGTIADRKVALTCFPGGGVTAYAHGTASATVRNISYGTTAPSGGSNGDIYLWYA